MMHRLSCFAVWSALSLAPPLIAAAPTAEDVLAKARNALGGQSKLSALQSLTIQGTRKINMQMGEESRVMNRESEIQMLLPDRYMRSEAMELPGGIQGPTMIECIDGETIWRDVRSAAGANVIVRNATAPGAEQLRDQNFRNTFLREVLMLTLTPPPNSGITFTYAGQAEAPDGKADVLEAKGPGDFSLRLFLDQETHLPLMATYKAAAPPRMMMRTFSGPAADAKKNANAMATPPPPEAPRTVDYEVRFADYEKTAGLQLPKAIMWSAEGRLVEQFDVKKYTVNPPLSADKFKK